MQFTSSSGQLIRSVPAGCSASSQKLSNIFANTVSGVPSPLEVNISCNKPSCSSVCSVPSLILVGSIASINTLAGPPAPRMAQLRRCCRTPPPAKRPKARSAPIAVATAVLAEGKHGAGDHDLAEVAGGLRCPAGFHAVQEPPPCGCFQGQSSSKRDLNRAGGACRSMGKSGKPMG